MYLLVTMGVGGVLNNDFIFKFVNCSTIRVYSCVCTASGEMRGKLLQCHPKGAYIIF